MADKNVATETPRDRFQGLSGMLSYHQRFFDSNEAMLMLDFAMLQYQKVLCQERAPDPVAQHWKSVGATQFIETLLRLSEQFHVKQKSDTVNLNHRA